MLWQTLGLPHILQMFQNQACKQLLNELPEGTTVFLVFIPSVLPNTHPQRGRNELDAKYQ